MLTLLEINKCIIINRKRTNVKSLTSYNESASRTCCTLSLCKVFKFKDICGVCGGRRVVKNIGGVLLFVGGSTEIRLIESSY